MNIGSCEILKMTCWEAPLEAHAPNSSKNGLFSTEKLGTCEKTWGASVYNFRFSKPKYDRHAISFVVLISMSTFTFSNGLLLVINVVN